MTNDVKTVKYTYDAGGISGMLVGTTAYFFRRNILGDVTAIYDVNGVKKAEYSYDAWGTCYTTLDTDGIGSLNPFRYRGYYFVPQIGLYYLTTRFYDYMTGRFVNADVPSVCIDNGLTVPEGCNLYSYCLNNPVMFTDSKGNSPFWDSIGIGSTKLWSPNAATNKNIGGTLIKFGKYNRFDVEAGRGLHMAWKIFGRKVNHIPLGIMLSGLLGGI